MKLSEVDLQFNGFGRPWGQARSYDNIFSTGFDGICGINWYVNQTPFLQGSGDSSSSSSSGGGTSPLRVTVVGAPTSALIYDRSGSTYQPKFYQVSKLGYQAEPNQYAWTDEQGRQILFYGFGSGNLTGKMSGLIDANGDVVPAVYDANGRLLSLARTYRNRQTGFFYTYANGQTFPGKLSMVTLKVNGKAQRRCRYSYYGTSESYGLRWDLKTVVIEVFNASSNAWQEVQTSYYRYYTTNGSGGFKHGLKFLVGGEAYARMVAAGLDPTTASDTQVAGYADYYFAYDSSRRVTTEKTNGGATPGSGSVVNDVELAYNTFQQLATDYQSHSGVVNTSTTPKVAYSYANGSSNTIRLNTMTYPNARALNYAYGTSGSIDDLWDRVTSIGDSGTSSMVAYTKLGIDRTVVVQYPEPNIKMTYIKLSGEPVGDGGDMYTGLDRFGRVVDNRWMNSSNTDIDRFKYGFSRASNRLWRQNVTASSGGFDEQYIYDGLYQVSERLQGTLSSGVITGTPVEEEDFTLDPTGNWPAYVIKESGTTTLSQTRAFQKANEITSIDSSSSDVGYDANGNMTTMPEVDTWGTAQTLTYDAWNRPITVKQSTTTLGTYRYDGLNRRISKVSSEGGISVTRHFYYSIAWQVLEERTGSSTSADRQYVWGTRYRDDLVLRDRFVGTADRLYSLADYFQTTSLSNTSGTIEERYVYRAFGDVSYYSASYSSRSSSSYGWTYLYGGYQLDLETNLYQVRNRYYHSALGRWLSRDPIGFMAGDANFYRYVANNAVNAVDPLGLDGNSFGVQKACPVPGSTKTTTQNPDGSNTTTVTNPDGSSISVTVWPDNAETVTKVNADGSGSMQIEDGVGGSVTFNWGPTSTAGSSDGSPKLSGLGGVSNSAGGTWDESTTTGGSGGDSESISRASVIAGLGVTALERSSAGLATMGNNGKLYIRGWGGGSRGRIETFKISEIAHMGGYAIAGIGAAADINSYVQDKISGTHLTANLAMGGASLIFPIGTAISTAYFAIDISFPATNEKDGGFVSFISALGSGDTTTTFPGFPSAPSSQ